MAAAAVVREAGWHVKGTAGTPVVWAASGSVCDHRERPTSALPLGSGRQDLLCHRMQWKVLQGWEAMELG